MSTTFNTFSVRKHSSTSPVNPTPLAELACEPRRRTGSADDTTELLSSEMPAAAATPPPDLQQRQQREQPTKHNKAGVVKLQQRGVHAMQPGDNGSARYTVVEEGELVTGPAPQSGRRLGTRWRRRQLQLQLRRRWLGSAGRGAAWRETPSQWWLLEGLVGAWGCICAAHRTKPQDAHIAGSVSRIVLAPWAQ